MNKDLIIKERSLHRQMLTYALSLYKYLPLNISNL